MSDKPFRADCKAPEDDLARRIVPGKKNLISFYVNPAFAEADVQVSNFVQTFDVAVVSPREIRLVSKPGTNVSSTSL